MGQTPKSDGLAYSQFHSLNLFSRSSDSPPYPTIHLIPHPFLHLTTSSSRREACVATPSPHCRHSIESVGSFDLALPSDPLPTRRWPSDVGPTVTSPPSMASHHQQPASPGGMHLHHGPPGGHPQPNGHLPMQAHHKITPAHLASLNESVWLMIGMRGLLISLITAAIADLSFYR